MPRAVYVHVLAFLLLFSMLHHAAAQCSGLAEWQTAETNRFRCGTLGFIWTNGTSYMVQDEQYSTWKAPTKRVAFSYLHVITTYTGGVSNTVCFPSPCSSSQSSNWNVNIPFEASADLSTTDYGPCRQVFDLTNGCSCVPTTTDWPCAGDCGNLCQIAFSQLYATTPLASPSSLSPNPLITAWTNDSLYTNMTITELQWAVFTTNLTRIQRYGG